MASGDINIDNQETGLTEQEAQQLLAKFGPNEIQEKRVGWFLQFIRYFISPLSILIEAAAILSLVLQDWVDFALITFLLFLNAIIGFTEERSAGNAIAELKKSLSSEATVMRDGEWKRMSTRNLVPGDLVRAKAGDVAPADFKVKRILAYLEVDQSSLTGESLPVTKTKEDLVYSGSLISKGDVEGIVDSTGKGTFIGKTASLVSSSHATGNLEKVLTRLGTTLLAVDIFLVIVIIIVSLLKGVSAILVIRFCLVLTVAAVPVALPSVLSVTMALGALRMARDGAVVATLTSVEAIAGLDILCSDKTGTLTMNQLTVDAPWVDPSVWRSDDAVELGALASDLTHTHDPIDLAIIGRSKELPDPRYLSRFEQISLSPFDPVSKRVVAKLKDKKSGDVFLVTKGAAGKILDLVQPDESTEKLFNENVEKYAQAGMRVIAVALAKEGSLVENPATAPQPSANDSGTGTCPSSPPPPMILKRKATPQSSENPAPTNRSDGLRPPQYRSFFVDPAWGWGRGNERPDRPTSVPPATTVSPAAVLFVDPPTRCVESNGIKISLFVPTAIKRRPSMALFQQQPSLLAPEKVLIGAPVLELEEPTKEAGPSEQLLAHPDADPIDTRTDWQSWILVGLIPLLDPERPDSISTIATIKSMGLRIILLTGDQTAIAREIARRLGLGGNIISTRAFADKDDKELYKLLADCSGVAEVFPEHKHQVVKLLQSRGHMVGMTGDGSNDAPALKQANVGIAVSGATDVARSSADISLTRPGLAVIGKAIIESRKIYQRMRGYAFYRVTVTIQMLLFLTVSILAFNFYLPAVLIVLIALLNDAAVMVISFDKAVPGRSPERWNLIRLVGFSLVFGALLAGATFGVFFLALDVFKYPLTAVHTVIYLHLSLQGHLAIFSTRTFVRPFLAHPPSWLFAVVIIATQVIASFFAAYGVLMAAIGWLPVLYIWCYSIVVFLVLDVIKQLVGLIFVKETERS
ncbi:ion-transporting P-type ATPase [Paratrimastix pyriformis]|uniref:Ion-transporting P-type ATPase n=1 Tax=Paratrimastix pyriformis TaxID=342808 RepID=A0ABQ8UV69_9EUKA|nr:ion-transporting P-type ATPase [Paratrimastix pyriformis]